MSVDSRCDHNTIWLAADCRSLSYSTRYAMRFAQQQDVSYASFLMAVILNFPACFKHSRSSMCATTPTRPVPDVLLLSVHAGKSGRGILRNADYGMWKVVTG